MCIQNISPISSYFSNKSSFLYSEYYLLNLFHSNAESIFGYVFLFYPFFFFFSKVDRKTHQGFRDIILFRILPSRGGFRKFKGDISRKIEKVHRLFFSLGIFLLREK